MTDNSSIPVAAGNETFANNDIGGVKYPRVKLVWGAAGAANDASAANPIPITGTVTANGAVTNAGTFATQETGGALTALQLIDDTIVAQGTALGTTKNSLMGASVTTAAPTYTTGQVSPLSMDTAGNQRVTVNPAQLGTLTRNSVPVITGGFLYQTVAAGTTSSVALETGTGTGIAGDYLEHLVCIVTDPANSRVQFQDGAGPAITALPPSVAGGVGTYHVAYGILSKNGPWRVSTQSGVEVLATGRWT